MRILIVTQYFPPEIGAPQIRLAALIRALKRRGDDVEVVTAMPHHLLGKIYPEFQRKFYMKDDFEGTPVHRTWVYAATGAGLSRVFNYLSFTLTSLLGLAKCQRPDYVFVESPPLFLGVSSYLFAAIRRVPMIFNIADLWPDSVRELGVIKNRVILSLAEALERWIYARSRFVNATTAGIKTALIEKKHLSSDKILFLPNGVDTTLFAPRPQDLPLCRELGLEGKFVFVYAGTHGVAQG